MRLVSIHIILFLPAIIYRFYCVALHWQLEPDRSLATRSLTGTKKSKNRVTILLTCNASGTEKLRPLFIHKHKTPRPLRGIDRSSLAVEYYWNSTAWMQTSIFSDYLKNLNNLMRRHNRKILLLVDNAPTHVISNLENLTNIRLHYLPPNTTAHLQPCDAGIIHSFKVMLI